MEQIIDLDKKLFLLINGWHDAGLDEPMYFISGHVAWIPLYAVLLYFIFRNGKQNAWIILVGIALTILFADQVSSTFMKPLISRPRPTWDYSLHDLVHIVNDYRGGKFGFPSSHAANTFGVSFFLVLVFRSPWAGLLFLWSLLVSYSRIYLGVHFPLDIIVGWIVGAACTLVSFNLYRAICKYLESKRTPSH